MKLIILFGPPAVGKMTVGQELARLTGYKLLHNHMTIDLALEFFEFGSAPFWQLVGDMRRMIVRVAAGSDMAGLIFTFVWGLDLPEDKALVDELCGFVTEQGGSCYFAELAAKLDERLRRNRTENRAKHKGKLPFDEVERFMLTVENEGRGLNSNGDFPYPDRHIKIENSSLSAGEAALQIVDHFGLLRGLA